MQNTHPIQTSTKAPAFPNQNSILDNKIQQKEGASPKAKVFTHRDIEQQKKLCAREAKASNIKEPKKTQISKFIEKINADIKGVDKDEDGFPEIANTIIDLGKYIKGKQITNISSFDIKNLNALVIKLLNANHFAFSENEGRKKLWAVHVDIIWLSHEMKKKNIFEVALLEENTQDVILEKGKQSIAQEAQTPLHPLLKHNFNAVMILWTHKMEDRREEVKEAKENISQINEVAEKDTEIQKLQQSLKKAEEEKQLQTRAEEEKDKSLKAQKQIAETKSQNEKLHSQSPQQKADLELKKEPKTEPQKANVIGMNREIPPSGPRNQGQELKEGKITQSATKNLVSQQASNAPPTPPLTLKNMFPKKTRTPQEPVSPTKPTTPGNSKNPSRNQNFKPGQK